MSRPLWTRSCRTGCSCALAHSRSAGSVVRGGRAGRGLGRVPRWCAGIGVCSVLMSWCQRVTAWHLSFLRLQSHCALVWCRLSMGPAGLQGSPVPFEAVSERAAQAQQNRNVHGRRKHDSRLFLSLTAALAA